MSCTSRIRRSRSAALLVMAIAIPSVALGGSVTRASAAGSDGPRWSWPVGAPIRVVNPFAAPPTPYSAGHRGIDLTAATGGAVTAPVDATVWFSGVVVDRPVLTLAVGGDVLVSFEPVVAVVSAGDRVARGQSVGAVASGGHCEGCVHVGVRVNGAYVSPLLFFDRVPRAILLPMDGSVPVTARPGRFRRAGERFGSFL